MTKSALYDIRCNISASLFLRCVSSLS
jgi:hypothetical protein